MYTVTDLFMAGSDSSILSHGSLDIVRKLRNKGTYANSDYLEKSSSVISVSSTKSLLFSMALSTKQYNQLISLVISIVSVYFRQ